MTQPNLIEWRRLSRRSFLLSAAALAAPAVNRAAADPACVLISEQEEGPYYIDGAKLRANLTESKPGLPLTVRVALVNAKSCEPLRNAALDIWHCDASGVYSGFTAANPDGPGGRGSRGGRFDGGPPAGPPPEGFGPPDFGRGGGPPGGRGPRKLDETRFLRGVQITNSNGVAEFATIYPGWYSGRAIHVHLKVHMGGSMANETYAGGHISHTGQLFFPEEATERIAKSEPYLKRLSVHRTTQEEDGIFQSQHGAACMVRLEKKSQSSDAAGLIATVTLAVDPDATPRSVGMRGPMGPPPGGR
jgi:protocatechuate 3,4-dioxygenase beta subunit